MKEALLKKLYAILMKFWKEHISSIMGKKKGQDKELPLGVMVELREHNKKTSNFERLWVTEVCAFVKT